MKKQTTIENILNLLLNRRTTRARKIEELADKITCLPIEEGLILFEAIKKAAIKMGMTK